MATPQMKIVGHCFEAHHTPYWRPPAQRLSIKLMGHGLRPSHALCWNPLAAERLPKMHRRQASLFKFITVVSSTLAASTSPSSSSDIEPLQADFSSSSPNTSSARPLSGVQLAEEFIEKTIFNCRFFTLMGVVGSLTGSVLCFFKGCTFVVESFREYFLTCLRGFGIGTGKVILLLIEAVDVYLMGTVMLIFGMGLYELFISALDVSTGDNPASGGTRTNVCGSNLFGLFRLRERPKWLEIRSLDELKTKLGHVIVMILLVGMFEKSKKVPVHSGVDLLCFSASILLSAGSLYLLSRLHSTH